MRYASRPDNLREIARQLGVANILEGSVQRAAGAIRVNVQLIEAESDSHLWAETYDRDIKNIFSVESEVAQGRRHAQGEASARRVCPGRQRADKESGGLRSVSQGPVSLQSAPE